jgi:acetate---CoA ligase (ADP-forming)
MKDKLTYFFRPSGVAIIGASSNPAKLSYGVVKNLKEHGYRGGIYPVNPRGGEILGLTVYPSILEVPDPLDLAVIMVPAPIVPIVLKECGERGLEAVIVITGGFREAGPKGKELEKQLRSIIETYGIRLIGPNCVGVMDAHLPLDTTFIADMPAPGAISFVSHSGAICGGTTDWARQVGVGYSRIASLGNQLDVDVTDGLTMMRDDRHTRVINIYAEGLPDGRRFVQEARAIYRSKPIVMLKAGVTSAGTRAVASHTGALAGSEEAYRAACHRAGTLVVDSLQEQNDVAMALAMQPLPSGDRVAILTNAGGPAALAADELARWGLSLAEISDETREALHRVVPDGAQLGNPVDMLGGPRAEMYSAAGRILLEDAGVDILMSIFVPQAITPITGVAQHVVQTAIAYDKPVIGCLVGGESIPEARRILNTSGVPCYQDPNRAARALAGLCQYARLRTRPDLTPERIEDVDVEKTASMLRQIWQKEGPGFLDSHTASRIAEAYGIRVPLSALASSPSEAVEIADHIGYPVAMKLIARDVVHKADVGGIALNLDGERAVRSAFDEMIVNRNAESTPEETRVMVQQMAPQGQEIILGAQRDPQFGPLLMVGMGGHYVEIFHDVAFRLAPLNRVDALTMVEETAAGQIMKGIRGAPSRDISKVTDVLCRVGQLVSDFPCISELDINPLIVGEEGQGVWAVDVRIAIDREPGQVKSGT